MQAFWPQFLADLQASFLEDCFDGAFTPTLLVELLVLRPIFGEHLVLDDDVGLLLAHSLTVARCIAQHRSDLPEKQDEIISVEVPDAVPEHDAVVRGVCLE